MINTAQAAWLGLVQGITEFLPISSSGHLVLGQRLLGLKEPELLFDVSVHVGTLAAVLFFFRDDLWSMLRGLWAHDQAARQGRRLLWLVVWGSLPTAALGLLFKDLFESLFASTTAVGTALIFTGLLLTLTRFSPAQGRGPAETGWGRALLIGLAQGLAIVPGLSRSGTTISAGLLLGLDRRLAAHYSFVLSVPAILGALFLQLYGLEPQTQVVLAPLLIGGAVAAASGYLALKLLLKVVRRGKLHWFAPYCVILGLTALGWSWWG
jgi:undecaprenyl-diphosphatase